MTGIEEASARVKHVRELLAGVRNRTVSVNVLINDARLNKVNRQLGERAAGGPVTAGVPYIVGEDQPEVFVPETNGRIEPSVSAFMGSRTGGSSTTTGGRNS